MGNDTLDRGLNAKLEGMDAKVIRHHE